MIEKGKSDGVAEHDAVARTPGGLPAMNAVRAELIAAIAQLAGNPEVLPSVSSVHVHSGSYSLLLGSAAVALDPCKRWAVAGCPRHPTSHNEGE